MSINIKNEEVVKLAKELAQLEHQSMTRVIQIALQDRLFRVRAVRKKQTVAESIMEISRRCASLQDRDTRGADEILGYDKDGLP